MDEPEMNGADARALRFLRGLVMVLTATMIVGIATLVVLFVTRFPGAGDSNANGLAPFRLPERIALPDGAEPMAITQGPGWWAVVTEAGDILIFDAASGALRQRVTVD